MKSEQPLWGDVGWEERLSLASAQSYLPIQPHRGLGVWGLLEGETKPDSLGLPVWAGLWRREEEEEGGEEPASSAVCSARISRLLWLSPPLFRPLRQARRAAVGSVGRRSPLGRRHSSRQLAPSSALKWTCKRQNTCLRAWRTEAWLTGLFKSTAWPPTGQPSCGGVTRRCTLG